jgi:hypothetical protein
VPIAVIALFSFAALVAFVYVIIKRRASDDRGEYSQLP